MVASSIIGRTFPVARSEPGHRQRMPESIEPEHMPKKPNVGRGAPMPKQNPSPPTRSKVRIFYVDADLAQGDMQELTIAITSAIRPTHVLARASTPKIGRASCRERV